jgi:hypothetical protein
MVLVLDFGWVTSVTSSLVALLFKMRDLEALGLSSPKVANRDACILPYVKMVDGPLKGVRILRKQLGACYHIV